MRELVRILFLAGIVGFLAFAGGATVYKATAAEVEHDIIMGAFEDFFEDTTAEVWEVETYEEHTANFGELWADLPADSYCELWVSAGFLLSLSAETIAGDDIDASFAPGVAASIYLIEDLDRMAADCLKEGI